MTLASLPHDDALRGPIRVRPAPRREPPFDDELTSRHLSLVGPLDQQLPFEDVGPQTTRPAPVRRIADDLPPLGPFARRLVIAIIETVTGRRSPFQLRNNLTPAILNGLSRDAGHMTRLGTGERPATLHSVHIGEPSDGAAEIAAVIRVGTRFRAIALRLEAFDGRWRCVRLQIG